MRQLINHLWHVPETDDKKKISIKLALIRNTLLITNDYKIVPIFLLIITFIMRSEKPYTKSENVISRFPWQCIKERTRNILKRNCLKSSILHRGMAFQRSKLQKASFEKKCLKIFFRDFRLAEENLKNLQGLYYRYCERVITVDESWIHHDDPKPEYESETWLWKGERKHQNKVAEIGWEGPIGGIFRL